MKTRINSSFVPYRFSGGNAEYGDYWGRGAAALQHHCSVGRQPRDSRHLVQGRGRRSLQVGMSDGRGRELCAPLMSE